MQKLLEQLFTSSKRARASQPRNALRLEKASRFVGNAHGNAVTELAVVMPLFLLLMCGVIDLSRIFYAQTTLQNAVRQGGRYPMTGNHQPDPVHQGQTLSRVNSIIAIAQQ